MSPHRNEYHLDLHFEEKALPGFFRILQKGFFIKARVGCSINGLFCGQMGISPDYFEERVQTIFMDGNPVDDSESSIVKNESCIALSGAMPGLVGAVLRKGGFYSSLRSGISYREKGNAESLDNGVVFLKIFNLLLKDLGPAFLEKGIWVEGNEMAAFFRKQPEDFRRGFRSGTVNSKEIRMDELLNMKWPDEPVFIRVKACD